jgi:hypothetical protein
MRTVKEVGWKEFLTEFEPEVHEAIKAARMREGVDGVAMLQCGVLDSSRCGMKTALIFGSGCTFKTVEQMDIPQGVYTNGLPSSASFLELFTKEKPNV